MDTTTKYREIIKQVILEYAQLRPSHGQIRFDAVCDEIRDRYALMHVGWDNSRRVRGNLLYVVIQGGKVLIEYDGIGYGISSDLIARGIPETDIIFPEKFVSTAVA